MTALQGKRFGTIHVTQRIHYEVYTLEEGMYMCLLMMEIYIHTCAIIKLLKILLNVSNTRTGIVALLFPLVHYESH